MQKRIYNSGLRSKCGEWSRLRRSENVHADSIMLKLREYQGTDIHHHQFYVNRMSISEGIRKSSYSLDIINYENMRLISDLSHCGVVSNIYFSNDGTRVIYIYIKGTTENLPK